MAMTESSNLSLKARDILATPSHEGAGILVENLFTLKETKEKQTASALYIFCITNFPNCLVLKLLNVYQSSSNGLLKSRSIYLLSQIFTRFRTRNIELSPVGLHEIKPLLIECLMQETKESDITHIRRIVSFITYNVMMCDNSGWFELSDCILSLASKEPLKAFHVFVELPSLYGTFMDNFMEIILENAATVVRNPEKSTVENWGLAVETIVKMGIQLLDNEMRSDLITDLLNILVKAVKDLVEKGMEPFLLQGLFRLESYLSRDKNLYKYSHHQCEFVKSFMFKIKDYGTQIGDIGKKIIQLVETPDNLATKLSPPLENQGDNGPDFDRRLNDYLKTLSSLEVLRFFVSTDREERSREIAIRRLEVVLSDHISKKKYIHISEIRQLLPLLITCLKKKGISDSMFKVLGQVVNHVAIEIFVHQMDTWQDIRDYFVSQSKTNIHRAVYVFQCLTMRLPVLNFLVPVMNNLLPGIHTWLKPPKELLVDNSCWVLAFTGAFCAVLNLINFSTTDVQDLAEGMTNSVRELVRRKMEVGIVRRAFIDMERIVKQQLEWYKMIEYKFVKGLLWKLYAIEGMTWDSKIVLWRINVIVERDVVNKVKELPNNNLFDWLNLDEDDDDDDADWVNGEGEGEDEDDDDDTDDDTDEDEYEDEYE